jgi:hypothetical protein
MFSNAEFHPKLVAARVGAIWIHQFNEQRIALTSALNASCKLEGVERRTNRRAQRVQLVKAQTSLPEFYCWSCPIHSISSHLPRSLLGPQISLIDRFSHFALKDLR